MFKLGKEPTISEGLEEATVSWGQVTKHPDPEKADMVILEIGQCNDDGFELTQGVCTREAAEKALETGLSLLSIFKGIEEEPKPAPGTDQKVAPAAHRKGFCDLCGDPLPPGPGASMKHRAQAHPELHKAMARKGAETTKVVGQGHKKVTKALAKTKKRK